MSLRGRTITYLVAVLLCSACSSDTTAEPSPQAETEHAPTDTSNNIAPDASPSSSADEIETPEHSAPSSAASFDPQSIHVLVNKHHGLSPESFEPSDLVALEVPQQFGGQRMREEAAAALEELVAAAADDGVELWVTTAYRDYEHQRALYEQRFTDLGQEATDHLIARPGYSEHQTGLAVDMSFEGNEDCNLRVCFAETQQGQWLADNASKFGFIIRYPDDAETITGYSYEPWHLRYVAELTATEVTAQDVTLEEYWNRPPAPDYLEDYQ